MYIIQKTILILKSISHLLLISVVKLIVIHCNFDDIFNVLNLYFDVEFTFFSECYVLNENCYIDVDQPIKILKEPEEDLSLEY